MKSVKDQVCRCQPTVKRGTAMFTSYSKIMALFHGQSCSPTSWMVLEPESGYQMETRPRTTIGAMLQRTLLGPVRVFRVNRLDDGPSDQL